MDTVVGGGCVEFLLHNYFREKSMLNPTHIGNGIDNKCSSLAYEALAEAYLGIPIGRYCACASKICI